MGENDKDAAVRSNALLGEILVVLERIDGHLEAQESRIGSLDAKVGALTSTAAVADSQSPVDGRESPATSRKDDSHPNYLNIRPRDLRLQTVNRTGSASHRESIASQGSRSSQESHALSSSSHKRVDSGKIMPWRSMSKGIVSSPKTANPSKRESWHSIPPPPTAIDIHHIEIDDDPSYGKFPPPQEWIITRTLGTILDIKYGSAEARALWTEYVGDSWTIPPDGRVEMTFQQHLLERLEKDKVTHLLQTLRDVSNKLEYQRSSDFVKRGSFRVTDFGFNPNFKESVAEYRAEFFTGKYKKDPVSSIEKRSNVAKVQTAPWKRMIEVRGLSKVLIDEHETWTQNFRNPWTEALPIVSTILPFFTDREKDKHEKMYTGMNAVNQALLYHQQCLRRTPLNEDDLTFHITFYEVVGLISGDELDGEIWRSGKLHSDDEKELENLFGVKSRRIRESACTIVVVPDYDARFWTTISLFPNNFDLYDKIPGTIMKQNAQDVFTHIIEFTMRMVVKRWSDIADYFAGLIGHCDTLSDPDAHDSLLFDDDTFSRSRKYFWAINYLAELDMTITENIGNLARYIGSRSWQVDRVKEMDERLGQLKAVRARLRAHRDEAIALRDGLFSASGVIESRASTRIGENVKLLTFVSIFFLPLSFCMSIWSVNNTIFSLKALLIVVILVGLGTYLIVFNLNNMVNFCSRVYDKHKKKLIVQMKRDPDTRWHEQGKRFLTFKPKQESFKPSEWVLGQFIIHKMFRYFSLRGLFERKKKPKGKERVEERGDVERPRFPDPTDLESPMGEPQKIRKVHISEKNAGKRPFSRWSKVFRRDALSPTLEQQ